VSYLGIIVSGVFAANALLVYGFEICPGFRRNGTGSCSSAIALAIVDCIAASLLWGIRVLALEPLRIERIDLFVFVLIAVPLLKAIARLGIGTGQGFFSKVCSASDDLVVSSLVFGTALIVSRASYSLPEAVLAGACSGLGYWLAAALLEALHERLELSSVPGALRGAPIMLISTGLMAMAFMGIDAIFIKNLVG
jgi:Na+-translocating ferredoxin:NAD+ oxidoreductase subunit A